MTALRQPLDGQWAKYSATGAARSVERVAYVTQLPSRGVVHLDSPATPSAMRLFAESPLVALADAIREVSTDLDQSVVPNAAAVEEAESLLEMLPTRIIPPEPVVEEMGTVAWVWDHEPGKFLALAVNGTGTLQYSSLASWGTAPLGDTLPVEVLALLAQFSA